MRFHLVAALYVLYFSRFYSLAKGEKAVLCLTIGLVFAMELLNTAVENAVNASANTKYHPFAKLAKDAAAGAVLAAAVCSVLVGLCLFADIAILKKILQFQFGKGYRAILFVISIILGVWFIFYPPKRKGKQEERKLTFCRKDCI